MSEQSASGDEVLRYIREVIATFNGTALESSYHAAGLPAKERTGNKKCQAVAADPWLRILEEGLQENRDPVPGVCPADAEARQRAVRRWRLSEAAAIRILEQYGVPSEAVEHPLADRLQFGLSYAGSRVRLTIADDITTVESWSGQLDPQGGEDALAGYYKILAPAPDRQPQNLSGNQIRQQVRQAQAFALTYGIRSFHIYSPRLSLGLPAALHVLEQSVADTIGMEGLQPAGVYSFAVTKPGQLQSIDHSPITWAIKEDGSIERITP